MTADRHARLGAARLMLIAPEPGPDRAWDAVLARVVEAGVDAVQVRLKGAPTELVRAALRRARAAVGERALLFVNDDLLAVSDGCGDAPLADGLHLGREDAERLGPASARPDPPQTDARTALRIAGLRHARQRLPPGLLLGTSTRTLPEVAAAQEGGADLVGFGAIAASTTKADTTVADLAELRRIVARHPRLPVFAIGGVDAGNLAAVLATGCRRVAVGAAIWSAPDPAAAARRLRRLLEGAGPPCD